MSEAKKNPVKIDASKYVKGAKSVAVLESWKGLSPAEVAGKPEVTSKDLPQVKIKEVLGVEVAVLGFQNRQGVVKGKTTDYKIIMAAKVADGVPFIFITGGSVICKKLDKAAEEGNMPLSGVLKEVEGDDFNYFDFTAA